MPGIYIRKAGWIDWSQKRKDLALTVPGSYWLCHKQNIYKFIFKYHRATRNIKQFNCVRELMQVIRKIIKNPPQQGQQFSTHHLLITFNHIAWTRQDKMFALMQFKERSVSPFSYAFVLNIKVCYPLEVGQNARYTIACTYSVQSSIHSKNENINVTHDYENQNDESSVVKITQIDKREIDSNKNASTLVEDLDVSFKLPTAHEDIKFTNKIMENNHNCLEASGVSDNAQSSEISNVKGQLNDKSQSGEYNIGKNCAAYKNTSLSSNDRMISDNGIFDDTNVDSANLPYQYLIEKEIENAKQNSRKRGMTETHERDSTKDIGMNSDAIKTHDAHCSKQKKFALNSATRSSDITDLVMEGLMFTACQGPDSVGIIQQKAKMETNKVLNICDKIKTKESGRGLHNSNLHGLENLIAMVELPKNGKHNSECQYTIGKDPTLRNQSVLTKHLYDIKYSLTNNKSKGNIASKVGNRQWQSFCNRAILSSSRFSNNSGINTVDKDNYFKTYDNSQFSQSITFSETEDLIYKEDEYNKEGGKSEEAEEEEDIIPEALQNELSQPALLPLKVNKFQEPLKNMPNEGLLMDHIDNREFMKSEKTENEIYTSFSKPLQSRIRLNHNCSNNDLHLKSGKITSNSSSNKIHNDAMHESNLKHTKNLKPNCPLVVSEQIVSLNQIPLPLQTIIRNKLSMKHTVLNTIVETSEKNINTNKARPCKEQDNVTNTQLNNQTDGNLLSAQYLKHHELVNNNIGTYNETTASTNSLENLNESNVSVKNFTMKLQESEKQHNCIDNVEKFSSSKITDITQQFYHDLSYFQEKRNLIDQKHLRQRQTSLNLYSDNNNLFNGNNGENHIQMVKLFQDITRGAKVVIKRISINKYS